MLLLKDGKNLEKYILYYTGRGVPSETMARTNILTPLQESDIPNIREAKALYERESIPEDLRRRTRLVRIHPVGT